MKTRSGALCRHRAPPCIVQGRIFSQRTDSFANPGLSGVCLFVYNHTVYKQFGQSHPRLCTRHFIGLLLCSHVFLSYLRFCSPSRLDQATMVFAVDTLLGSCVWSHQLILLLSSARSSPFTSPLSMSRRLATPSTRGLHCLVHVASLPYLYRLASSLWSRAELREACLCELIR